WPLAVVFFVNDTATTEIYTLSLHDALPISTGTAAGASFGHCGRGSLQGTEDRKSTRLNSSHLGISYAVFCLKKRRRSRLMRPTSAELHPAASVRQISETR